EAWGCSPSHRAITGSASGSHRSSSAIRTCASRVGREKLEGGRMTNFLRMPSDRAQALVVDRAPGFDVERVRADFPILQTKVRGHDLVYLDNAATSQKPRAVIEAITRYYERDNANIHRGVHSLSERATAEFEAARKTVQTFLNARQAEEIVFVRGATEAI